MNVNEWKQNVNEWKQMWMHEYKCECMKTYVNEWKLVNGWKQMWINEKQMWMNENIYH